MTINIFQENDMLNIVVPMAGLGSRFANAGFSIPKPLLPLGGKPMIQWVIENIRPSRNHRFIFICHEEHLRIYPEVRSELLKLCPGSEIICIDQVTEGAACTVLLAKEFINNENPLMIANSDQYVDLSIDTYLAEIDKPNIDGLIMTFWADHPKWSYCRLDTEGFVREVIEKQVISNDATVGIYNFKQGKEFVRAAEGMIEKNLRVNGEFYVAPAYNLLINDGSSVVIKATGKEFSGMYGLGTPDDYNFFQLTESFTQNCASNFQNPLTEEKKKIRALTEQYITFFDQKNRAGIDVLLHPEIQLQDPSTSIQGKVKTLDYIYGLFDKVDVLNFQAENIFIDNNKSIIEFRLQHDDLSLIGTDILEWDGSKIRALRAYLYEK
jgi:dTDP-glucose pyrophosphorylase